MISSTMASATPPRPGLWFTMTPGRTCLSSPRGGPQTSDSPCGAGAALEPRPSPSPRTPHPPVGRPLADLVLPAEPEDRSPEDVRYLPRSELARPHRPVSLLGWGP